MTPIRKALCWAAALIALAVASAIGLVENDTAQTLFVVVPAVAWMNISGRNPACSLTAGRRA